MRFVDEDEEGEYAAYRVITGPGRQGVVVGDLVETLFRCVVLIGTAAPLDPRRVREYLQMLAK